jgi:hypothetical protein
MPNSSSLRRWWSGAPQGAGRQVSPSNSRCGYSWEHLSRPAGLPVGRARANGSSATSTAGSTKSCRAAGSVMSASTSAVVGIPLSSARSVRSARLPTPSLHSCPTRATGSSSAATGGRDAQGAALTVPIERGRTTRSNSQPERLRDGDSGSPVCPAGASAIRRCPLPRQAFGCWSSTLTSLCCPWSLDGTCGCASAIAVGVRGSGEVPPVG